ncbi:putative exosome component CSL4 [Trypanosoma cruzi]|uniref:Exosome component CSL4, putative n=2 Tax=Trypanosoma cruzi TaxID=5693 RepID=Q4CR35_TRYCC|nr:exosome component CSL4, putative [Trypanosoma cruzi]EAN82738.1 exosome component CSL4, putative [Trypanosoma cruzi]PWV16908.1 putative exosome component CSL4 [Trypanosoma cruzi]RNC42593.1 exosome component CSL4 [Trypanosoma cruzi]|eukprot:XP_804589.1 exosome component CSL4 [Trypanosoma cruzi strain CL Brener]
MTVAVCTGRRVVPGDVVYSGSASCGEWDRVAAGEGCCTRIVAGDSSVDSAEVRQIIATRLGTVQWSESTVSVQRAPKRRHESAHVALISNDPNDVDSPSALARSTAVFGPRLGDTVYMRVVRVSRAFAYGEIIAVNGVWCSNSSVSVGLAGSFRGVVRVEDIRPFKPTKDQLTPPPPAAAFHAGDVVMATVLSQSDVRQYQLSTMHEHCGVVEASVVMDRVRVKLQHIPGRRDAMRNPTDGTVHYRWCPLIHPAAN